MDVTRFEQAEKYQPEEGWERVSLAGSDSFSFEWFVKPPGHSSPDHSHENEQVLVVLQGEITVHSGNTESTLKEFDSVHFQSGESHRVENTGEEKAVGIDVFAPARSFDFWLDRD